MAETKERAAITKKKAQAAEIQKELKSYPNLVIIDLRNLPDKLLQSMRKKLREGKHGHVRVAKSTVLKRALDGAGKPAALSERMNVPAALVLTSLSPYDLNQIVRGNKLQVAAKPGQISPADIIVPAGETDLPAGPALSELKTAGVNVQIKAGKIAVNKDSTVVKKGEEITLLKAKALQTLGIKPFEVGMNVLLAYDGEFVYAPDLLDISAASLSTEFVSSLVDAMNLSVNAKYPSPQSIEMLLVDAYTQGRSAGINGGLYSTESMEQLLTLATRQGLALEGLGKK
ncbi:MAG: 50S ribosomal protein L10 [Candidatus Micrarchaeia archaeon]|jgi:large subunit ribosomal protein L10